MCELLFFLFVNGVQDAGYWLSHRGNYLKNVGKHTHAMCVLLLCICACMCVCVCAHVYFYFILPDRMHFQYLHLDTSDWLGTKTKAPITKTNANTDNAHDKYSCSLSMNFLQM